MFSTCMSTTGMAGYEYQSQWYLQLCAARLDVLLGGGRNGQRRVYARASQGWLRSGPGELALGSLSSTRHTNTTCIYSTTTTNMVGLRGKHSSPVHRSVSARACALVAV